jgi:hypothetical protein
VAERASGSFRVHPESRAGTEFASVENIIGLSEQPGLRILVSYNKIKMKARLAKNSSATRRKPASERVKKLSQTSGRKGKRVLSEDEADILYCEKHKHEKAIPWERVKAKLDAMDG